jgi:hypothetical protein
VSDPIHVFWGLIAILGVAAALNHRWHHARHSTLDARLVRASERDRGAVRLDAGLPREAVELDAP